MTQIRPEVHVHHAKEVADDLLSQRRRLLSDAASSDLAFNELQMSKLCALDAALRVVRAVIDEESGARHEQRAQNASGEPDNRGAHV